MRGSTVVICFVIALGIGWAGSASAGLPSRCAEPCQAYLDSCLDYCDQHPGQQLCRDLCYQDYFFCLGSPNCTPPLGLASQETDVRLASDRSSGCEVHQVLDAAAEPEPVTITAP
jgi:hypothetical protein